MANELQIITIAELRQQWHHVKHVSVWVSSGTFSDFLEVDMTEFEAKVLTMGCNSDTVDMILMVDDGHLYVN